VSSHLTTTLGVSRRARLHEHIANVWVQKGEKQESLKASDPADMETEYEKYFPSE